MKIDDDHLYHGSALIQIAEDPHFTAINSLQLPAGVCRSAYRINDNIGVYLKYASKPTPSHREYVFTFHAEHIKELEHIAKATTTAFLALVCVKAREVCCLPYAEFLSLVDMRRTAKGASEDQYVVLVTVPAKSKFRVYVNSPGRKNTMVGKPLLIARSAFPTRIFA
ncbi:MAG TPA: hypothetical protein VGA37_08975 [Gemmatimonadales bacterium]